MNSTPRVAVAASAVLTLSPSAYAESFFQNDTHLSVGIFFTSQDTTTAFDSSVGDGTDIDFESDLGLDSSLSVFRFDGFHRFAKKHRVGLSVFDLSRAAVVNIEGEIEWQDTIFPVSATIATDLDFTIYKLVYTYEFLQRQKGWLGASLGLHTMDVGIRLADKDNLSAESSDVTAPLPLLGIRGGYALGDRWSVFAGAELFFAEIQNIKGTLHDLMAGIEYQISDRFALALAFNDVELDVDASEGALEADLVWRYSGGLLSFRYGF